VLHAPLQNILFSGFLATFLTVSVKLLIASLLKQHCRHPIEVLYHQALASFFLMSEYALL